MNRTELDQRLVQVVPHERQVKYQAIEFYGFVHFTVNTFTGKEWGEGTESPSIVNPYKFDANQWVTSMMAAGMKGLILTCKHHDGFCLWPSKYTNHSIEQSPYKDGTGDLVKEVSDACKKHGMKFGVYLSPWDRNHSTYGFGTSYNDYFINQLTELLTNYGEIFSVWFDGACGEGTNGKKQVYDWDRYYELIRRLQPNACINVCGPDVRWCGNEAGDTREAEWSVVPARTSETERIAADSQQSDDTEFRQRTIKASDGDLGSREILENETDLIWYPAEVNTSIRPGWFYHKEEDDKVRSLNDLLRIYYNSVGGNAMFLLNIPPTNEGLIHENDVARLAEMGDYLKKAFATNLVPDAIISASVEEETFEIINVLEDSYETYFKTPDEVREVEIMIEFPQEQQVSHVVLKENIYQSQRIERFTLRDLEDHILYEGTVVGYKKIIQLDHIKTKALKLQITDARVCPTLSFIGVYA